MLLLPSKVGSQVYVGNYIYHCLLESFGIRPWTSSIKCEQQIFSRDHSLDSRWRPYQISCLVHPGMHETEQESQIDSLPGVGPLCSLLRHFDCGRVSVFNRGSRDCRCPRWLHELVWRLQHLSEIRNRRALGMHWNVLWDQIRTVLQRWRWGSKLCYVNPFCLNRVRPLGSMYPLLLQQAKRPWDFYRSWNFTPLNWAANVWKKA